MKHQNKNCKFSLLKKNSNELVWKYSVCSFLCFTDCGIPVVENAQIIVSNGTVNGSVAEVTCNEGYSQSGSSVITCLDDGWNYDVACEIQGKYVGSSGPIFTNIVSLNLRLTFQSEISLDGPI